MSVAHKTRPDFEAIHRMSDGWQKRLALHLANHYQASLEDVEPTMTPGWWQFRTQCSGECRMGHRHKMRHTISYHDRARGTDGRWVSPYRTWHAATEARTTASEAVGQ